MRIKLLFPVILLTIVFSCGLSNENKVKKNCISVEQYLKELNLYVHENCLLEKNKMELRVMFYSKEGNNKQGNRPYFLDNKSNKIIADLLVHNYYNKLKEFDTVTIVLFFIEKDKSMGEGVVQGYTKSGIRGVKLKYDNQKLLKAHEYIVKLGYSKYIRYDIAIKKGLESYDEDYFIYDILEDLLAAPKPNPSSVFDFIISMAILNEGYPEYNNTTLELYKLIGIKSDTIISEPVDMYEYVKNNVDSTYQKPW